jgi:hypothetical protein
MNEFIYYNEEEEEDNGSFTFCVDVFFPLSLPRFVSDLTVYMSTTAGVLYEGGTICPSLAPEFTSGFFCWVSFGVL